MCPIRHPRSAAVRWGPARSRREKSHESDA
jgi:hypothetical protein